MMSSSGSKAREVPLSLLVFLCTCDNHGFAGSSLKKKKKKKADVSTQPFVDKRSLSVTPRPPSHPSGPVRCGPVRSGQVSLHTVCTDLPPLPFFRSIYRRHLVWQVRRAIVQRARSPHNSEEGRVVAVLSQKNFQKKKNESFATQTPTKLFGFHLEL